ncbi:hypothetical protein PseudUWO311_10745 [Pseudanabaena sp. UWO311]|uniref:competence protein CoiA family protein n=1 Tax=Pseudanabaena sp. UWO311 TaxID=2487337 RepID=UPI001158B71D|nr:hypothetical protein [Pseudanabaena sp. UWO311]TYQ26861.1 hypothetical protein PseudUWO311_10745 [Pseudanabaena sp. UWO311]
MIKYKFAYDSQQKIIDIQTLSKATKQSDFICLGCGNEMVPVLGEKKVKHFRHKVIREINCSPETYLHKLAKTKFYQTYQDCLDNNKPFKIRILKYPVCNFYEKDFLTTCLLKPNIQEFELTQFFKKIYLEHKVDSFIPDVLLESDNKEKIFFEVVVTHLPSEAKINSNYRIIQFIINSEENIKEIESCILEESHRIQFINFKKMNKKDDWCKGKCINGIVPYAEKELLHNAFIIDKNGRSRFIRKSIDYMELLHSKVLYFEYVRLTDCIEEGDFYKHKIVEAYRKDLKIKNCFLCRYHAEKIHENISQGVFCKFLKKSGDSNMAVDCQYLRPDPQVFSNYTIKS